MEKLDLAIIGSGPGGYVAAIRAAQLGRKVTLFEKGNIGGTCLNVGCIPSKALLHAGNQYQQTKSADIYGITSSDVHLDFEKLMTWKDTKVVNTLRAGVNQLLKKNKVEIIIGEAKFNSDNSLLSNGKTYQFKDCLIATGSTPVELKIAPFGHRVLDSTGLLNIKEKPESLIVIGAGYIGSELAQAFATLGTKVTLVEATPNVLPGFDTSLIKPVLNNFKELGINVLTNTQVTKVEEHKDHVVVSYGNESLKADYVLVSVGRRPNTNNLDLDKTKVQLTDKGLIKVNKKCQTTQENIYAIGDIIEGHQLAHKASYEAKVVARVLAGQKAQVDYKAMPAVCYTSPEIATTGLQDLSGVEVSEFPLMANSRSIASTNTQGFVRLLSDKEDLTILGAQLVGENVSELLTILTLAIEVGLTLEDIALTVFPHPSYAEAIMDAAEIGLGLPIHL